jgi:hypothetical protein
MSVPDELLMAYADGELSGAERAAERAQVEAAMRADPEIARKVEKHRAMRRRMNATFDRVLDEPVPDRLIAAVRKTPAGKVTDINRMRAKRVATAPPPSSDIPTRTARSVKWSHWGAAAASFVIGAIVAHFALTSSAADGPIASRGGHLVAQAGLADALSNQLASQQATTAPVQIGTTFKTKAGEYCRTFTLRENEPVGGLACLSGSTWSINTLARVSPLPGADGTYRQAGTAMPAAVRAAVEEQIVGDPLDSSAEAQARTAGWK